MQSTGLLITTASVAFGLAVACNSMNGSPERALRSEQQAVDAGGDGSAGTFALPDGGTYTTNNDWGNMGVQDVPGYTGINNNSPQDQGLIAAEQQAANATDGGACIFGAHGGNPADNGGQTTVQALPGDTSQSIFHPEYHPECLGVPTVLSVCYAGAPGTNGNVPIASAICTQYNVPCDTTVACTGQMGPGNPMLCYGSLVDGNGNPIGNQTIGGLNINQVRGDPPPGSLLRCGDCDGGC